MSPNYIRDEYFGLLLKAINTRKVFTSIKLSSLSEELNNTLSSFDVSEISDDVYDESFKAFAYYIGYLLQMPKKGVWKSTVVILSDQYYHTIEKYVEYYEEEDIDAFGQLKTNNGFSVNIFPFGVVDNYLIQAVSDLLPIDTLSDNLRLMRTSVYFSTLPELTETYDFRERIWEVEVFVNQKTGKEMSAIHVAIQKTARDNEQILIYINEEGKRKIRSLVTDNVKSDFEEWCSYRKFEEEMGRRNFAYFDEGSFGYGSDNERGCGNGWLCSCCPNYGCPANEHN